jgi:hypothetical protein
MLFERPGSVLTRPRVILPAHRFPDLGGGEDRQRDGDADEPLLDVEAGGLEEPLLIGVLRILLLVLLGPAVELPALREGGTWAVFEPPGRVVTLPRVIRQSRRSSTARSMASEREATPSFW